MAETALSPQYITRELSATNTKVVAPGAYDGTNQMKVANTGQDVVLILGNADTVDHILKAETPNSYDIDIPIPPQEWLLPASTPIIVIPPLPSSIFNNSADNSVYLKVYAADGTTLEATGVTIKAIRLQPPSDNTPSA